MVEPFQGIIWQSFLKRKIWPHFDPTISLGRIHPTRNTPKHSKTAAHIKLLLFIAKEKETTQMHPS